MLKTNSLRFKLLTIIFVVIAFLGFLFIFQINKSMKTKAQEDATQISRLMLNYNLATHTFINKTQKPSFFANVHISPDVFIPELMSSTYVVRQINNELQLKLPFPYYYKEVAINARSPENEANGYEVTVLNKFKQGVISEYQDVITYNGEKYFVYMTIGESMEKTCLKCHSTPSKAPKQLVRIYGNTRSFNRNVGDLVSALSIRIPLNAAYQAANNLTIFFSVIYSIILLLLFVIFSLILNRFVLNPVAKLSIEMEAEINDSINDNSLNKLDELGKLSFTFKALKNKLKISQEALQEHAKKLEELVVKRTKELEESNNELKLKNEELDQFAYTVSHDLKAPLRGIKNLSAWIEEDLENNSVDEVKSNLTLLKDKVTSLENMITGILQISRVGKLRHIKETFNAYDFIDEIIKEQDVFNNFNFEIKSEINEMTANKVILKQIISNLISNALKHHHLPSGQVTITLKDEKDFYIFEVEDNGPGIPSKYHEKIFNLFETIQVKANPNSTGIGLALVKKLVEGEHGKITLKSEIGKGSTFAFTLKK